MSAAPEIFDVIIVGAGSAGCALAEGLSADPRLSVLLLEAGGSDRRFWIKTPIGYGVNYHNPRVNWRFYTAPDPGIDGRAAYWPRGKVLGGSSSINAMVYCRGLPEDYDDWRAAGNPGWGWADVERVYGSFEAAEEGAANGGALSISRPEQEHHPIRERFFAAAGEIGLRRIEDLNGPAPEGVGAYAITTRRGLRWSAADAFLRPALRRGNLVVRARAQATRVLFEGRRAVGVAYSGRRGVATARARAMVVLAAGAIGSPHVLQLSGVGPSAALRRLGVDAVAPREAVGGGLQDHLGVSYFHRATEPTLNQVFGSWRGRLAAGLRFLATRGGPLSLSVNQSGGFARSAPGAPRPDVQLYFNPMSYTVDARGARPRTRPDPHPGFDIGFSPCRPISRGRVDAASPDPFAPPLIQPAYLSAPEDLEIALAGARLIGRLQETAPLRALIAGAPPIALSHASDAAILADFRARAGSVYHPCGSCRMAPEAEGGVVDTRLRVYGVEALRVVDASIFPNITSANTNAPSIMVGRRAAEILAEDLRG